jgi:hypothetical protein
MIVLMQAILVLNAQVILVLSAQVLLMLSAQHARWFWILSAQVSEFWEPQPPSNQGN